MANARIRYVTRDNPIHRIPEALKQKVVEAQRNLLSMEFKNAFDLCQRAFDDLKISIKPPVSLRNESPESFGDRSAKELSAFFTALLAGHGIPSQAVGLHSASLLHQIQLIRAFPNPDVVIKTACEKVVAIVGSFPRDADDIRCGRNPGDVLDPYILGAAQVLMCGNDFEHTVSATVAHKGLMIVEGLLGHLHEDVIGAMRGNVRIPEPRGKDQETLDPATNPFPGADVLQPPQADRPLRFHQIKSKTGSAKGGDGHRLGVQLNALMETYGGEAYYDAIIGNTLRGHRSMAGVQRVAPSVVVLVGNAAFQELTGSVMGPQLLLRLYQSAFEVAARETGYAIQTVVSSIYQSFKERADELGEGFLEAVLHDATAGSKSQQDSRQYISQGRAQSKDRKQSKDGEAT